MHKSFEAFLDKYKPEDNNMFFVTTKGKNCYSDVNYNGLNEVLKKSKFIKWTSYLKFSII